MIMTIYLFNKIGNNYMPKKNDNQTVYKLNTPLLILEYPDHPTLVWQASKITDLWLLKLYGLPRQPKKKQQGK